MTLLRSLRGRLSGSKEGQPLLAVGFQFLRVGVFRLPAVRFTDETSGGDLEEIAFGVGDYGFVISVSGEPGTAHDSDSRRLHGLDKTINGLA